MPKEESLTAQQDEFVSRKLIRPTFERPARTERKPETVNTGSGAAAATAPAQEAPERVRSRKPSKKFSHAAEQTHAENFYFQKQIQTQTLMTIVLRNGEEIQGRIEWYDRNCIKLERVGKPDLLLYKSGIKFMHKAGE